MDETPQTIGKTGMFKQGRNRKLIRLFTIVDAEPILSKTDKDFCLVAQKLEFQGEKPGIEYRAVYYVRSERGHGWQFSIYAPSFNPETMATLAKVFSKWARQDS